MARRKENIVYHNIRMNLDNEQHRRIHKVLTELNTDVHKSVNQFLIDATDEYISRLEGNELTKKAKEQLSEPTYIVKEDLDRLRIEIKDELQKEMIGLILSCMVNNRLVQLPETKDTKDVKDSSKNGITEKDLEADETTVGLVSLWG